MTASCTWTGELGGTKSAKRHLRKLRGKQTRFRKDCDHVLSKQIVESVNEGDTIEVQAVGLKPQRYVDECIKVMHTQAHVPFINPLTSAARPDPQIDFAALLRRDTLVSTPPGLLDDALSILNWLEDWVKVSAILGQLG